MYLLSGEIDWFSELFINLSTQDLLGTEISWYDISALLIRIILAIIFISSFLNKSKDITGFAKQNGLPIWAARFQVYLEGIAGVMIGFGIFTQLGALFIMLAMTGSLFFHIFKWKSKYWASSGGWEYDLMIFAMASMILVTGGGWIAVYPLPLLGWFPFI